MALKDFNWKALIAIALLAGLIQVATGVAMYGAGVYFASWSIFISFFVLLLGIGFGTRRYRDSVLNGQITYGQALLVGIVISVCTGVVYAIYNIISISFFYPRFLDQVISVNGALRGRVTANTIALSNLIRLSVFGTILSAIASFFLRAQNAGRQTVTHTSPR
jgi:hypothetical protein